jgi:hypothetical protein
MGHPLIFIGKDEQNHKEVGRGGLSSYQEVVLR